MFVWAQIVLEGTKVVPFRNGDAWDRWAVMDELELGGGIETWTLRVL